LKELEQSNEDLTGNCVNMEYLMQHLKLDNVVKKIGIKTYLNDETPFDEGEYEKYMDEMGTHTNKGSDRNINEQEINNNQFEESQT
jgi:hypothetical protein